MLGARVLREALDAGSKSAYWPWLRLLPRDVDSTVGWNEDELSELSGSNVVVFTRAIKAQWRMEYDALDDILGAVLAEVIVWIAFLVDELGGLVDKTLVQETETKLFTR